MLIGKRVAIILFVLGGFTLLPAAEVIVGTLRVDSGVPTGGMQSIVLTNYSGPGCDATFALCDSVGITGWNLTVHLDGGSTSIFSWESLFDDISSGDYSGSVSHPWVFSELTQTITSMEFTGTVSPDLVSHFYPDVNQTFKAGTISLADYDYDSGGFVHIDSYDPASPTGLAFLMLSDQPADTPAVPEPASLTLVGAGALAVICSRLRRAGVRAKRAGMR